MNTKKMGSITLALAVAVMLVTVLTVAAYPKECKLNNATEFSELNTLRVYGEDSFGPGDSSVRDPLTGNVVEDLPYTESIAPFDPQHIQAPPKDSITFNPLLLSVYNNGGEFETSFLSKIKAYTKATPGDDPILKDAIEKVFWRQWYEPMHWDKDVDCNGLLECVIYDGGDGIVDTMPFGDDEYAPGVDIDDTGKFGEELILPGANGILESVPGDANGDGVVDRRCCVDDRISCDPDEAYPAIMQEYTFMLLEGKKWSPVDKPEPTHGQPGGTQFVFPVGMRATDFDSDCGYGLTSLDADFDGEPDIVNVESELSLFKDVTRIAADFNGNDMIDPLDNDGFQLSGDELVVFTIDPTTLKTGERVQFLDHMVEVDTIYNSDQVRLKVYYMGDVELSDGDTRTVAVNDMLLAEGGSTQIIEAVSNGGDGTNICDEAMPWFAWIEDVDFSEEISERTATIVVGRALGHAHTSMEESEDVSDGTPDPWFLKRFYVDGHEYNVVAIETLFEGDEYDPDGCDVVDTLLEELDDDTSEFKYITIRTPKPKEGTYENGGVMPFYLIEQHSVRLEVYDELDYLSIVPPFNYEHVMVEDVQGDWSMDPVLFLGDLQYNTAPITQTTDGDHIWYMEEKKNPQFTGELLEKYNECGDGEGPYLIKTPNNHECEDEWWYAEQYNTKPDQYTEFVLPEGHGLYLLTSAFVAPSAQGQIVMQDELYELIINGNRVKFWFDPADGTKIYKDDEGLRVFGEYNRGPGDTDVGVDVLPYTDPVAVFNPQRCQSPRKDSITFDPAYMAEYIHTDEPLKEMYNDIKIEGRDAREKTYFRLWYEPDHWEKDANKNGVRESEECYPAVMEEFTYIYLDINDQPSHGAPGENTKFAFPIATDWADLYADEGYGLNTFDCDFDGVEDVVMVYSEAELMDRTGVAADFNGDNEIQTLDLDDYDELSGDEIVVFAVDIGLDEGAYAMFLDHMVKVDHVSSGNEVYLDCYCTGGGLSVDGFAPTEIGTVGLHSGEMAILERNKITTTITPGDKDGAWFVYVIAADDTTDSATLLIGRALGETHVAIEDPEWYMKRFYVDGHEYNVVAVKTVPEDEFKFVTIRTPVPKVHFEIEQHTQDLEDYPVCNNLTVMPPFNYQHTVRQDVLPGWTAPYDSLLPDLAEMGYMGPKKGKPPLDIHIKAETNEPRFLGELKEMYNKRPLLEINSNDVEAREDDGVVTVSGHFGGPYGDATVDGRSMSGGFAFTIEMVECDDGVITGWWRAAEARNDDAPPLYNDNNISSFDGVIEGSYDRETGDVEMVWHRGELNALPFDEYEMHHDYLCFWAEFEFDADLMDDGCEYTGVEVFPERIAGEWDDDWEEWMTEQFWTRPDQYTEFELPSGQYYLLTSSWYAPQAVWRTVNENNGGPYDIEWYYGNRVKFWYNPDTALDLYVNQDTPDHRPTLTLVDLWDGNGNGHMDLDEMVTAILAYLGTGGTEPTMDQLVELLVDYLMHN